MMSSTKKFLGLWFFIISAGLHFLLTFSLSFLNLNSTIQDRNQQPIEVTFEDPKTPINNNEIKKKNKIDIKNKVIVEQEKLNNDIDKKAKFLSDHNQRAVKETVALNHGDFQNVKSKINLNSPKTEIKSENEKFQKKFQKFIPDADFFVKNEYKRSDKNINEQIQNAGGSSSQTKDYLPDTEKGMETILSTQEFVYFTYYNRIRNQLNQYWEPKIKEKMIHMFKKGRKIASKEDQITKVLITLNTKGELVKVKILSESGTQELDEVALEAFKLAAPFPNPPKGIANENGVIEIRWDFVVET